MGRKMYSFNDILNSTNEIRGLGIPINVDLDFEPHIKLIVRKAFGVLYSLCRTTMCNIS